MRKNDQIYCHDFDLITLPEGSNCIHQYTDAEINTQWFFIKLNQALKSHPITLFNIIRFKIKINFHKIPKK